MDEFIRLSGQIIKVLIVQGLPNTILLSLLPLSVALGIGIVGGVLGNSKFVLFRLLSKAYVYVFRNIPFLIFVYVTYYGLPSFGYNLPSFATAIVALSINHGAYMTEIIRGGLNTLRKTQIEASASIGLNIFQQLRLVIIPQTLMEATPSIVGQIILLVKDTSIISVIGISELTRVGRQVNMLTHSPFIVFFYVAILYYSLCFFFQKISDFSERKVRKYIGR